MLRHCISLIAFLLISFGACGQLIVRGELLNTATEQPIPYANIGVLNKNKGTISNLDGTFEMLLDSTFLEESLTFSALGYEKKVVGIQQLIEEGFSKISLDENPLILKCITIRPDIKKINARREEELGNFIHTAGTIRLDSAQAGGSVALLINNKKRPAYLHKAKLYIMQNSMDVFKVRVRLYKKDENTGLPGGDLLDESVVITSSIDKGWLEVDLANYNIRLKDSEFFLAFEWIMDKKDRKYLANDLLCFLADQPESLVKQQYEVGGKLVTDNRIIGYKGGTWFGVTYLPRIVNKSTCYYRLSSLGQWKRSPAILTAGVSVVKGK